MVDSNLEAKLNKRLKKSSSRQRSWQKSHYELAKSLGFSAQEATILQNWKEADIRKLAEERGYTAER